MERPKCQICNKYCIWDYHTIPAKYIWKCVTIYGTGHGVVREFTPDEEAVIRLAQDSFIPSFLELNARIRNMADE